MHLKFKKPKIKKYYLTNKALALIAAIDSGLLPKVEGGWDDTKFQIFWDKYEAKLKQYCQQE